VNEVHRSTHAFDHPAGDHPVGESPKRDTCIAPRIATSILPARIMAKLVAESKKLPPAASVIVSFPR